MEDASMKKSDETATNKFRMRLAIKRFLDVEITAKNQKEAHDKGYKILERGLEGKEVGQVEWIEEGKNVEKTFGSGAGKLFQRAPWAARDPP